MGKVQKPLTLIVDQALAKWPEWAELHEKGHNVVFTPTVLEGHVYFGPQCWLMDEEHRQYISLAIKNAQAQQKKNR